MKCVDSAEEASSEAPDTRLDSGKVSYKSDK